MATKNSLGPTIFETQFFKTQIFWDLNYFWIHKLLGPTNPKIFRPKIYWDKKIYQPISFGTQNFRAKYFWNPKFRDQKLLLVPKIFSTIVVGFQNFSGPQIFQPSPSFHWLYYRFLQPSHQPTTHPPNKVYFDKEKPYPISSFPWLARLASLLSSATPSAQATLGLFYLMLCQ